MISEAFDFRYFLLENYKKMKISENELVTILMVDHLIGQGNPFITADYLSLKMSLPVKEIDAVLASLLTKGYIEYITEGKKTVTTLEPLKQKLFREFQVTSSQEFEVSKSQKVREELENIFLTFEKLFGRSLSPVEASKVREWISYGYTDEMIINAAKDALAKGKRSLRSVDKILLTYMERADIEKEGHTPLSEDWDKNLEETIRIAKTPWANGDK